MSIDLDKLTEIADRIDECAMFSTAEEIRSIIKEACCSTADSEGTGETRVAAVIDKGLSWADATLTQYGLSLPAHTKLYAGPAQQAARATLHPEQIADLAARCGIKGSAAALAEFAALVREAEPMAPDEMRPAPVAGPLTDAQISAGADVLCDCPNPKRIGRNAAIAVFDAMSGAAAPAVGSADIETLVREYGNTPLVGPGRTRNDVLGDILALVQPAAGIIGYVEPGHLQDLCENRREGCYIKLYAVPFSEASARPTVPLYATTAAPGSKPQLGETNVLKLPLTLNPAARGEPATCEVRDAAGRVLGTGFTPLEGSEAILRVNIHTELVSALRQARDALLNHVDVRVVAPAVERVEGVLGKAGAM